MCCYNLIIFSMCWNNQLQSTTTHQLKYKWKSYHKKTRTNHHKGIIQEIISQITITPWTLLITTRGFKKSQLLHLDQLPRHIYQSIGLGLWSSTVIYFCSIIKVSTKLHCSTLYTTGSTPYTGFNITPTTKSQKLI